MRVTRGEILEKLRERLLAFAASHYGRDAAEDLAQETLLVLHEKYSEVDTIEELVPLGMQIMRFKIAGQRRKSARRGEFTSVSVDDVALPDPHDSVANELEKRELLQRLKAGIESLGPRCRELMHLKLQGLGFPEIRERMHAESINTVYTWDLRCRKELLGLVGGSWRKRS